jgi:hypothetical protein
MPVSGSVAAARAARLTPGVDAAGALSAAPERPLRWVARDGPESGDALSPEAPADPSLSANAVGMAAIPAPTPRAKASAPTRPTYRA